MRKHRNTFSDRIKRQFLRFTGYTYSNLARLFMRLFVGVMFMQFGIRHWLHFDELATTFPTVLGLGHETCLILMIIIEILCSLFIIVGLMTRLSTIPPIVAMILAEYYIIHDMLHDAHIYGLDSVDPGYLPLMFIGIYLFILLAGPGRISLDYLISMKIIEREGRDEKEELDEV